MEKSYIFKYIIVGDGCVGKSCLLLQYTDKRFEPMHDITIGVEFGAKVLYFREEDTEVKIQVWDTAGQESFRSIVRSYYRGAVGALVVFDITKRASFDNIKLWLDEIKNNSNSPINITLVGNKQDLEHKRVVSREEALQLANDNDINYIETSAKTGHNVDEAFNNNIKKVLHKIKNGIIDKNFFVSRSKQIQPNNNINNMSQCYCA